MALARTRADSRNIPIQIVQRRKYTCCYLGSNTMYRVQNSIGQARQKVLRILHN